ncbi:MAG: metallophosphoesterase [Clostridia bacterium]|nr:metallophosphoesterase [Clostridia bacterium]
MKIGIISDTHQNLQLAQKAIEHMGPVDLLLHGGDHYRDALKLAEETGLPVKAVIGNCDMSDGPTEEILDLDGLRILLTHGHRYGVKFGLDKLYYRVREVEAQIAVFGHSHVPVEEWVEGILLFNPGSVGSPRGLGGKSTYGIIYINEDKEIKAYIHEMND